ncbi:hypothetical protein H0H81_000794 [Sphagnurus paluster]|uniref:Terpene synthase n=1 Tax=Sphagnurus paluster TaxID=117069 RepID=A0A9P7FMQ1_9AGAR|nr:hypothetical protein H0H81_000794 [Sphagnurus paluster]
MQPADTTSEVEGMLYIPDTLVKWPYPSAINPFYNEVLVEHSEWMKKFLPAISKAGLLGIATNIQSVLFAARGCPKASKETLRISSDFTGWAFMLDACTDCQPASVAREVKTLVCHVMHNLEEERPEGEFFLGQLTKEFWQSALKVATPSMKERFMQGCETFLDSTITQAEDRDKSILLNRDQYMIHRRDRDNICAQPTFCSGGLHLNIPISVFNHPVVREAESQVALLLTLDNDLLSYTKEYAMGDDGTNILTVIMREENVGLQEAVERLCDLHEEAVERFLYLRDNLPPFDEKVKEELGQWFDTMGAWVRSNVDWSFEAGRYYGTKGKEICETRLAPIPRRGKKQSHRAAVII